jgi:RimJ/RimL family protein N-acetyltransferase
MTSRIHERRKTRDGRPFVVREAEVTDAQQLIAHSHALLAEPQWNVTEPREFHFTVEQEEDWILGFRQRPHSILLVADFGTSGKPQVVAALSFTTQSRFRLRHRGRLGIGVQASYRGVGVGETLLRALLGWAAVEPELERVELSVFAHNTRAINLYRNLGFVEEARLARAFKLADGGYYDDVMMVKWVKQAEQA